MEPDGLPQLEEHHSVVPVSARPFVRNTCTAFDLRSMRHAPDSRIFSITIQPDYLTSRLNYLRGAVKRAGPAPTLSRQGHCSPISHIIVRSTLKYISYRRSTPWPLT